MPTWPQISDPERYLGPMPVGRKEIISFSLSVASVQVIHGQRKNTSDPRETRARNHERTLAKVRPEKDAKNNQFCRMILHFRVFWGTCAISCGHK